jgi:hypothetical protein
LQENQFETNSENMKYFALISLFVVLTAFSLQKNKKNKTVLKPDELKEWVSYLASDQMRGRRNGSPEIKVAATWISGKFSEYGLKPVLASGDFIQNYSFKSRQGAETAERNVIGFLEGSDPRLKNEFIILSAHFDHIGIRKGNPADSIANGADDNAAGTATVIGIAKYFKESGIKPGRSILFTIFSGEESGMRGSRYFVANSPVALKNAYADINFEMIGHSEYLGKNNYYMTGCPLSNLDDLIGEFNKKSGFTLVDTIQMAKGLFYASDNISFSRISSSDGITKGIPSGTFATTTEAPYIHSVADEVQLFDFENMAALVNHFSSLVIWLSNSKTEIKWTDPKFVRPE